MRKPAILFTIVLTLAAIILAPRDGARAQDAREGPTEIDQCQTISQPGSYKLIANLTFNSTTGTCLSITASFVTIDLAGYTIGATTPETTAIAAGDNTTGITIRNGSISSSEIGVELDGNGSIVEGLRVFGGGLNKFGIIATGIVRGNTVVEVADGPSTGVGISATGVVTGNYVNGSRDAGFKIGQGSTVVGNTATSTFGGAYGFLVSCPSNVTDNTAVNKSSGNLILNGNGCTNTNNVAP